MTAFDAPSIEPAWRELRDRLLAAPTGPLVYIVGAPDTGKTTLTGWLGDELDRTWRVARIDADPGQSAVGPPACLAAAWADDDKPIALRFVGDVTPEGRLLQTLTGSARLVEAARQAGAQAIVLDSSGYAVPDAAREFQHQLIDLLRPDHLLGLQRGGELEPILKPFDRRRGVQTHRLPASSAARRRSADHRRRRRADRFAAYFADAGESSFDLRRVGLHGKSTGTGATDSWRGRLVGLVDRDGLTLALGVVRRIDEAGAMRVFAPPLDPGAVVSVHVGSLTLDPETFGGTGGQAPAGCDR